MNNRFVLVGALAGKTVNLGGHNFVDGVFEFVGTEPGVFPGPDEITMKGVYLAKSYQAYLEGSNELKEAQARVKSGKASKAELDVPAKEVKDQQEAGEQVVTDRKTKGLIRTALGKLDAKEDAHWTDAGLPSVQAVRELAGIETVSRGDINILAPKLTREEAAKVAADPLA